jgi:hypothetical protein
VNASQPFEILNLTQGTKLSVQLKATDREREILKEGGFLNYSKAKLGQNHD